MENKQPPPYIEVQPGFTPAQTYQPQPTTQPPLYPPLQQPPVQQPPVQQPPVYQAPPYGQPPLYPPPTQQSTVIIHTSAIANRIPLGSSPSRVRCPACRAEILTTVRHQPTMRTHVWAMILCLFGCWPCVCVPYCVDSCQNASHYCPNCNSYIGTYEN